MVRSAQHRLVVRYHPWLVSLGLWLACTAGLRQALGLSPASLLRSRAVSNSAESAAANQLLLLKSEIELLLNASPATGESVDAQFLQAEICSKEKGAAQWVEEVVSEQKVCGKEAVEQVVQEAQRLLLQLDRSDGRPDLSAPVLANRFYALAATCLRTKGAAWTAAVGPLEYVGLRLCDFIQDIQLGGERIRVLDSVGLCHSACSVLLDLDLTKQDCAETAKAFSTEERRSVLDLNLSLSRIALRYAIYKEQLLEHQIVEPEKRYPFDSIEILSPVTATAAAAVGRSTDKDNIAVDDKVDLGAMASEKVADSFFEVIVPCSKRFEAVMLYDLGLDEDDLPITGSKRLLFRKQFVQPFIDQNELIPAAESNSTGNSTSTAKI